MNRTESWVATAAVCLAAGWVPAQLAMASVEGTRQVCGKKALECLILVRVKVDPAAKGKCLANVDMDHVVVKGDTPFTWVLVKTDMSDTDVYEFVGEGVIWDDDATAKKEFRHRGTARSESRWSTFPLAASAPARNYKPSVRRVRGNVRCDAPDPRIINDGA